MLFGFYLIVQCFVMLGGAFTQVPFVYVTGEAEPQSLLATVATALGARVMAAFVFNLIPGLVLLYKAKDWADRLLPPIGESSSYIEYQVLFSIGLTLLGYSFVVAGLSGVVASIVRFALASELMRSYAWEQSASSVTMLASGVALLVVGRRAV